MRIDMGLRWKEKTKMKFNATDYAGKKVAMHCKTQEEAEDFCKILGKHGFAWSKGDRYIRETHWSIYKENMVYYFNEGQYGDIRLAIYDKYTILEWEDFMDKEFKKSDLKNGDICVTREGNVYIAIPEIDCLKSDTGSRPLNDNYNNDLTCKDNYENADIVDVYRPNMPYKCSFNVMFYKQGEHVYHRDDKIKLTIADIAEKYGVDASDIMIVEEN